MHPSHLPIRRAVPGDVTAFARIMGEPAVLANVGLQPVSVQRRRLHALGLGLAAQSDGQGQGVGRALKAALCDWADRCGQLLRTELTVFVDRPRANARCESFGFRQDGRHAGHAVREGRCVDVFSMARLHPDPPRLGGAHVP